MSEVSRLNSTQINPLPPPTEGLAFVLKSTESPLPPAKAEEVAAYLSQNPELVAPLIASGLALEVLMEALGSEERKTVVKTSKESLKAKSDERKEANDKQLDEMKTRLEKMEQQKTIDGFLKAFQIIGAVVGVVGAGASLTIGIITGNPVLIVGGAVMALLAVNSVVEVASGGKWGIAQGITALLKLAGVDENVAQWIGLGVVIATAVLGIGLSLGGGLASMGTAASSITNATAQKVFTVARGLNLLTGVMSCLTTMGQGGTGIASSVNQYEIAKSRVTTKELEAILERLQEATAMEQEFLKFVVKKHDDLLVKIKEIVQQNNEALAAVVGGDSLTAPSMA